MHMVRSLLTYPCPPPPPPAAPLTEPDGVNITWSNAKGSRKNLGEYYLAAMDAIDQQAGAGKGPIYFIQVCVCVCVRWWLHS
jgi:hypothetical protein